MRASTSMIVRHGMAAAAALAAVTSLAAGGQTERSLNTGVVKPDMSRPRPQVPRPPAPAEQTIVLRDLPASIAHIATPPGWATMRQPRARPGAIGPGAGAAAYVERIANSAAAPSCALPERGGRPIRGSDIYDFRQLAKGFRVIDVRIDQLSPPFALSSAANSSIRYTHTDGKLTPSPTLFDGVYIGTRYGWQRPSTDPRIPIICWMGYRLHVTVRGPADVNPITGKPIRRSPVN